MSAPSGSGSGSGPPPPPRVNTPNLFINSKRPQQTSRLPPATGMTNGRASYTRPAGPLASAPAPAMPSRLPAHSTAPLGSSSSAARFASSAGSVDVDMESKSSASTGSTSASVNAHRPTAPSRLPPATTSPSTTPTSRLPVNGNPQVNGTYSAKHPGLVAPAALPSLSPEKQLERLLSRLLHLVPTLLESTYAAQPPLLDGLLLSGSEQEGLEQAWREKERREAEARATKTKLVYEQSGKELVGVIRGEVGKEEEELRRRLEAVEKALGEKGDLSGMERPPPPSVDDQRALASLRSRVAALEASLAATSAPPPSANVTAEAEQREAALAARIKADLSAAYESKFTALETRLAALSVAPAPAPPTNGVAMTDMASKSDLLKFAKKTDSALAGLEAKGKNLALAIGGQDEWSTSEKVLGKRRAEGEGAEADIAALRSEETVMARLDKLGQDGRVVREKVETVEGRIEQVEKRAEATGQVEKESGTGDVSMEDKKSDTQYVEVTQRLASLEIELASLKSAASTTATYDLSSISVTPSQLLARLDTLESSLSTFRTSFDSSSTLTASTLTRLTEADAALEKALEALKEESNGVNDGLKTAVDEVKSQVKRADEAVGRHANAVGTLSTYFTTNNRMLALDAILTAWQTQNPPPAAPAAGLIANAQAPTPPEEQRST